MKNITWCSRYLIASTYYYALATNEKNFYKEIKKFKIERGDIPYWVKPSSAATTHFLSAKGGKRAAIVCIDPKDAKQYTGVQVAALLVHEAVHIWQAFSRDIGETEPSSEFEAYSIQWLSQELLNAYYKLVIKRKIKRKSKKKA